MSSELFAEKLKRWTSHQTDSNRYVSDEEHAEMIRKLLAFQREELKPCSSKDYRWIKNLAVAQYGSDAYKLVRKAGGLEVLPASMMMCWGFWAGASAQNRLSSAQSVYARLANHACGLYVMLKLMLRKYDKTCLIGIVAWFPKTSSRGASGRYCNFSALSGSHMSLGDSTCLTVKGAPQYSHTGGAPAVSRWLWVA